MTFVLASASPRRLELLAQIGREPAEIVPADIDETVRKGENPRLYVERMAREKAAAITHDLPVLAADTSVILGQRILGKAENEAEAFAMIEALAGRRHRVISAVAIKSGENLRVKSVETKIKMRALSQAEIERYIATGEWQGKAGSYAIQGRAAAFVTWIQGSYSAVVGLPLAETSAMLGARL